MPKYLPPESVAWRKPITILSLDPRAKSDADLEKYRGRVGVEVYVKDYNVSLTKANPADYGTGGDYIDTGGTTGGTGGTGTGTTTGSVLYVSESIIQLATPVNLSGGSGTGATGKINYTKSGNPTHPAFSPGYDGQIYEYSKYADGAIYSASTTTPPSVLNLYGGNGTGAQVTITWTKNTNGAGYYGSVASVSKGSMYLIGDQITHTFANGTTLRITVTKVLIYRSTSSFSFTNTGTGYKTGDVLTMDGLGSGISGTVTY